MVKLMQKTCFDSVDHSINFPRGHGRRYSHPLWKIKNFMGTGQSHDAFRKLKILTDFPGSRDRDFSNPKKFHCRFYLKSQEKIDKIF